jgi:hypothetical protein
MTSGCPENPHDTESAEPCQRTLRPVIATLLRGKFGIGVIIVNYGVSGPSY